MSLVPTYVRAVDGRFYKNPMLVFEEGFICFDDDDPPELVLWNPAQLSAIGALIKVLGRGDWSINVAEKQSGERCDPAKKDDGIVESLRSASWWFFQLNKPIPVPEDHDGFVVSPPEGGDCVIYDFPRSE